MDRLPTQLRARRADRHDTQEQAAEAIGVSRRSLATWEQGGSFPGVLVLGKVAAYLGVTTLDLERLRPEAAAND